MIEPKIDIPDPNRSLATDHWSLPDNDFARLERISRLNLRMYDLTPRERRTGDVIIDRSFARGRTIAILPTLQAFCELTGLYPGDVSDTLKLMIVKKIVIRRGPRDAREYEFLPFAPYWQETKPLFDIERALARAAQLDRLETQGRLPDVVEPDLDDALVQVSRENAIADDDQPKVPSAEGRTGSSVTLASVSDSLIPIQKKAENSESLISEDRADASSRAYAHTKNVLQNDNVVTLRNVADVGLERAKRFNDPERNHIFEQLETLAAGADFDRYRPAWINRVANFPAIVREAIGDVKLFKANARNKVRSPGAMIFRRCQQIAKAAGKNFHML